MKNLKILVSSSLIALTFSVPQKTSCMEDTSTSWKSPVHRQSSCQQEELISSEPTKTTISPSFFSSLQSIGSNTVDWMRESALSGCDRFGRWVGSYAKDLPPAYFAKTFLEVDYAHDGLFWQGHFYQELKDLEKARFLGRQEYEQLKDIQEIIWNGLLSPYVYEEGLKELEKKRLFSRVQSIRDAFQSELKENPDVALQHLRKDLVNSLEEMQNNGEGTNKAFFTDFKKKLTYYRNVINAFDYAETIASLLIGMEQNKGKLSLPENQYKSFKEFLTNTLHKTDKEQYFQIKSDRVSSYSVQNDEDTFLKNKKYVFLEEETNNYSSFFSYPLSFIKGASSLVQRGVRFALENPIQAITMGIAFQAAAVAAKSSFALPPQFQIAKNRFLGSSVTVPLSNGNAIVAWSEDVFPSKLFGRVLDSVGTPITDKFRIDSRPIMNILNYDAARLTNGNVFVVWNSHEYSYERVINGRVINPLGNPVTNPFLVTNATGDDSRGPSVAALSNGDAFLAYSTYDGQLHVSGRIMNSLGKAVTNEFQIINRPNGTFFPSVTALGNGTAFVGCGQEPLSGEKNIYQLYGRVMGVKGNPVTSEFRINNHSAHNTPSVSTLNNGNILVAWNNYNDTNSPTKPSVYGRIMDAKGNPVTNDFCINDIAPAYYALFPHVTSLKSGNAFVVWQRSDSSHNRLMYGRLMNGFGKLIGSQFKINDGDTNAYQPYVSTLNNGNAFATWQSKSSDDDYILWGRIFPVE